MKLSPRFWTRVGITRRVFITARLAFKVPRIAWGVQGFGKGMLSNLSEQDWSGYLDGGPVPPNPVIWAAPFGLCNVYRRALPYDGPIDQSMFGIYGDPKAEHLGVVDGRLVLIDYDMHCGCWLQCREDGPAVAQALLEERIAAREAQDEHMYGGPRPWRTPVAPPWELWQRPFTRIGSHEIRALADALRAGGLNPVVMDFDAGIGSEGSLRIVWIARDGEEYSLTSFYGAHEPMRLDDDAALTKGT